MTNNTPQSILGDPTTTLLFQSKEIMIYSNFLPDTAKKLIGKLYEDIREENNLDDCSNRIMDSFSKSIPEIALGSLPFWLYTARILKINDIPLLQMSNNESYNMSDLDYIMSIQLYIVCDALFNFLLFSLSLSDELTNELNNKIKSVNGYEFSTKKEAHPFNLIGFFDFMVLILFHHKKDTEKKARGKLIKCIKS